MAFVLDAAGRTSSKNTRIHLKHWPSRATAAALSFEGFMSELHTVSRPRGRPRKYPLAEPSIDEASAEVIKQATHRKVRMGPRPCVTSRGVSGPGRHLRHGIIVELPAHEAENLVNLGYATNA